jgi:hypothetical protein
MIPLPTVTVVLADVVPSYSVERVKEVLLLIAAT